MPFVEKEHIAFYRREALAEHPNGMKFHAYDSEGTPLREGKYLSVGGGFVVTAGAANTQVLEADRQLPHPFRSGRALLEITRASGKSIAAMTSALVEEYDVDPADAEAKIRIVVDDLSAAGLVR